MSATGERGATLIEMLVVFAILALTAAIAAPSMDRALGRGGLAAAKAKLGADLRLLRGEALRRGVPAVLTPGGTAYDAGGRHRDLAQGITLAGPAIAFFPDGSGSGGTVTLRRGGQSVAVAVDAATGAVLP